MAECVAGLGTVTADNVAAALAVERHVAVGEAAHLRIGDVTVTEVQGSKAWAGGVFTSVALPSKVMCRCSARPSISSASRAVAALAVACRAKAATAGIGGIRSVGARK